MTAGQAKSTAMTDRKILKTAIVESFWKLDPRILWKNPVMFVVEVGAVITLVVLIANLVSCIINVFTNGCGCAILHPCHSLLLPRFA